MLGEAAHCPPPDALPEAAQIPSPVTDQELGGMWVAGDRRRGAGGA